ncbi:MAG: MarR family transcriptional regulator [Spirochaetales bacterium]|nr:MarR family transcriptional regulator [Spirochaetales bacterium]
MDDIHIMRQFNRTVTRSLGIFDKHYLGRPRPLSASRLLFEIGTAGTDVRSLRDRLGVDSGYMSRLLRTLEGEGLIETSPSEEDRRVRFIRLTHQGEKEREELDRLSDGEVISLLESLPPVKREALTEAMGTVSRLLETAAVKLIAVEESDPRAAYALASYYGELSERFGREFDPGTASRSREFSPPHGLFLVAELFGRTVGCGAVRFYPEFGEVKRMWVDPAYRGRGIASRILKRLEEEAARAGMGLLRLDTNDTLSEAKSMYLRFGYRAIERYNDNPFAQHFFEKSI